MTTFTVQGVFSITGRGTVLTGERVGPLSRGDYLYGKRLGFPVRGVEMHTTLERDKLATDTVGVLCGSLPSELFAPGDVFTTEAPGFQVDVEMVVAKALLGYITDNDHLFDYCKNIGTRAAAKAIVARLRDEGYLPRD